MERRRLINGYLCLVKHYQDGITWLLGFKNSILYTPTTSSNKVQSVSITFFIQAAFPSKNNTLNSYK